MRRVFWLFVFSLALPLPACAEQVPAPEHVLGGKPLKMLIRTAWPMRAGESEDFILHLWTDAGPVLPERFQPYYGKKLHLHLLSPDFKEYYHLYPMPTPQTGEYRVSFIPRSKHPLRAWAEFVTDEGRKVVWADINNEKMEPAPQALEQVVQASNDALKFFVDFPDEVVAGRKQLASVIVMDRKTDLSFRALEPVMGAFAHVVAFGSDFKTLIPTVPYLQPPGAAPVSKDSRAGPVVRYYITPTVLGMMPVFVQFYVGGRDVVAPFVVEVLAKERRVRSEDLENKSRPEHFDPADQARPKK